MNLSRTLKSRVDNSRSAITKLRSSLDKSMMARRRPPGELQPPRLDIELDGKRVDPRDVAFHPAYTIYYIVSQGTFTQGVLQTFLRPEAAKEYLASCRAERAGSDEDTNVRKVSAVAPPAASDGTVQTYANGYYGPVRGDLDLYDLTNYRGRTWWFNVSWGSINDFRYVYPPFTTNINDRVSSAAVINVSYVDPTIPYTPYVILFEHINKGGRSCGCHRSWIPAMAPGSIGI